MFGFEFMDIAWLPGSLRETLREILDCALSKPFRSYYDTVVERILERVSGDPDITAIAELGAGTGPLTQRLAAHADRPARLKLIVCDLYPHIEAFRELQRQFPDAVQPVWEPVDFSKPIPLPAGTYVVVSAAFHHVPPALRLAVLAVIAAYPGMIIEPLGQKAGADMSCVGNCHSRSRHALSFTRAASRQSTAIFLVLYRSGSTADDCLGCVHLQFALLDQG